ncbi:MAG: hypothetical protein ACN4GM_13245 [Gammaproteobacteria bacterium]
MDNEKKYIFDNPKNVKRLLHVLYGSCVLLFLLDFVIHRHVMHSWENLWGFYPLYGFVGCVVLVLVATWMRTFLMRSEDYYENEGQTDIDEQSVTGDSTNKKLNSDIGGHDVDA